MSHKRVLCVAFAMVVILAGVGLQACASSRTMKALEGTSVTDLPPVPIDLGRETECATSRFSTRCASVPSGTGNCVALLRSNSEMQLSKLIGQQVESQVIDKGRRTTKGSDQARGTDPAKGTGAAKGTISEDLTQSWNYEATVSGSMNFRRHESPLFKLGNGQEYAMRTCVVMEEAYYQIYTDMAESARHSDHPEMARVFMDLREERYGDNPPDHDKVREVETEIAQHYQALWKMTSKQ